MEREPPLTRPATGVLCVIPARQGSKSVPHKNLAPFLGKPLLVHAIEQALRTKSIERIIVSTDSEQYAAIARDAGAEVPFLRPAEISGDLSPDIEVFQHAVQWLAQHEGYRPEICVHLRTTYPVRRPEEIDHAIGLLRRDQTADSVRSVTLSPHTPFKMWYKDASGYLSPVTTTPSGEGHSLPRQALPPVYLQNASVDVVRTRVIEAGSMTGVRVLAFEMPHMFDIDDLQDLAVASQAASLLNERRLTLCVDIDGILATLVGDLDYAKCAPNVEVVEAINTMANAGHRVILCTARGSATGRDWRALTESQLDRWGVRYDELWFGKPAADLYVDDRLISAKAMLAAAKAIREKAAGAAQSE